MANSLINKANSIIAGNPAKIIKENIYWAKDLLRDTIKIFAYNSKKNLKETINSFLQQTFLFYVIIVCYDCSRDNFLHVEHDFFAETKMKKYFKALL